MEASVDKNMVDHVIDVAQRIVGNVRQSERFVRSPWPSSSGRKSSAQ